MLILSDSIVICAEKLPGITAKSFAFYQKICVLMSPGIPGSCVLPPFQLDSLLVSRKKKKKQVKKKNLVALDAFINSFPFIQTPKSLDGKEKEFSLIQKNPGDTQAGFSFFISIDLNYLPQWVGRVFGYNICV